MKRFIVVEDQTAIREMLMQLLAPLPGFECVGSCGDGQAAVELCATAKPEIAVLDMRLPGLHGVDLLRRMRKVLPELRVLIFSGHENPVLIREVIAAGALGFVEKTAGFTEFQNGLLAVSEGRTYYGPAVKLLLETVVQNPGSSPTKDFISAREREILKLVAESHSTKEIAAKLSISPKTVDNHRTNLMRKLKLHDVASLTRYAFETGIIFSRSAH